MVVGGRYPKLYPTPLFHCSLSMSLHLVTWKKLRNVHLSICRHPFLTLPYPTTSPSPPPVSLPTVREPSSTPFRWLESSTSPIPTVNGRVGSRNFSGSSSFRLSFSGCDRSSLPGLSGPSVFPTLTRGQKDPRPSLRRLEGREWTMEVPLESRRGAPSVRPYHLSCPYRTGYDESPLTPADVHGSLRLSR